MKKYFCTTCSVTKNQADKLENKLQPRICIGHILLFIGGLSIVLMELLG